VTVYVSPKFYPFWGLPTEIAQLSAQLTEHTMSGFASRFWGFAHALGLPAGVCVSLQMRRFGTRLQNESVHSMACIMATLARWCLCFTTNAAFVCPRL